MSDDTNTPPPALVDLTELRLMPSWVANFGGQSSRPVARYEEQEERPRGGQRFGGAGGAGGAGRGDRGARPGGPRPGGPGGPGGDRGRPAGGPGGDRGRRDDRGGAGARGGDRRDAAPRPPERPALPTGLKVTVEPEDKALEMLSQHMKSRSMAFSLFDATRLVLEGTERHRLKIECEAERLVGLFQVTADGALFETREEAVRYLLRSPEALGAYYSMEDVELEDPKGVFTSVAICGLSKEILGPPSHHGYQTAMKRIHSERFANMTFDDYRRNVRVDSSPEMVEKWKELQRKGTKWTYLKGEVVEGQEPASFTSRAEVETHFRRIHADDAVQEVRTAVVHATAKREQLSFGLGSVLRRHIEDAKRHMFEVSQKVAHGLERRGLKLFKRRSGKMFVCKVKPRAVDPGVIFSERVTLIVDRIKAEPGLQKAKLIEMLAPSPEAAPVAEGETAAATNLTDEQVTVIRDLHWLADEGYIIEYSDGVIFPGVQGEPPHHAKGGAAVAATNEDADDSSAGEVSAAEFDAPAESDVAESSAVAVDLPSPAVVTPVEAEVVEAPSPAATEADAVEVRAEPEGSV
jgi:hypothetical protein